MNLRNALKPLLAQLTLKQLNTIASCEQLKNFEPYKQRRQLVAFPLKDL